VKVPRRVILAFMVVLLLLVALSYYLQYTAPQSTGPWVSTTAFPLQVGGTSGVLGQACVTSSSYVYCVGGENADSMPNDTVYSSPLKTTGLGNWTLDQYPYPQPIMFESCVAYSGYVYCVGGTGTATGNDTADTYFAPITLGALGNWTATSPYPVPTDSESCTASSGFVFCVGGENETSGSSATATLSNSAWYASLSASGIGGWTKTTPYPGGVYFPGCSALGGYVYCVGGQNATRDLLTSTYYAPVSEFGLGQWTSSTAYPIAVSDESCATASTYLYCVGGLVASGSATDSVYYSGLSPSGIGTWQQGGSYPSDAATECVASSSYVYCVGGYDPSSGAPTGSSYYAPITTNSTSSSSSQ
jgi:hypothetical protein